mmetsp:Transcript_102365/g.293045  ORF Transcript_102365/g.293045 Transcript_102365/m.293045 type:complete len:265 (+) Transcript_102365:283-1077(+)
MDHILDLNVDLVDHEHRVPVSVQPVPQLSRLHPARLPRHDQRLVHRRNLGNLLQHCVDHVAHPGRARGAHPPHLPGAGRRHRPRHPGEGHGPRGGKPAARVGLPAPLVPRSPVGLNDSIPRAELRRVRGERPRLPPRRHIRLVRPRVGRVQYAAERGRAADHRLPGDPDRVGDAALSFEAPPQPGLPVGDRLAPEAEPRPGTGTASLPLRRLRVRPVGVRRLRHVATDRAGRPHSVRAASRTPHHRLWARGAERGRFPERGTIP